MNHLIETAKLLGWTKKAGAAIGVWANKPAGHRCLWTCRWTMQGGSVKDPHYWVSVEDLTLPMAVAELEDVIARKEVVQWGEGRWLVEAQEQLGWLQENGERAMPGVRRFLEKARQSQLLYPQYLCPWVDLGVRVFFKRWRPGWEPHNIKVLEVENAVAVG